MKDYQKLSQDVEIMRTSEGYMVYDHQTDDYLHDANGDNCFTTIQQATQLFEDLIKTRLEHLED